MKNHVFSTFFTFSDCEQDIRFGGTCFERVFKGSLNGNTPKVSKMFILDKNDQKILCKIRKKYIFKTFLESFYLRYLEKGPQTGTPKMYILFAICKN